MAKPDGKGGGNGGGGGGSTDKYRIVGTEGDDVIDGRLYDQAIQDLGLLIEGLGGNDSLRGGSGQDVLTGGDGDDVLFASADDLIGVGDGKIVYDGGKGSDTLDVSAIPFDSGNGVWVHVDSGPVKQQVSYIRSNADVVSGQITYDESWSNNFKNIENLAGGDGNDVLSFALGTGNNILRGGAGNDYLDAHDGDDQLFGDEGNDILVPGWGIDEMTGGAGNDTFSITGRLVGEYTVKTIHDFDLYTGEGDLSFDQIWLGEGWSIDWDESSPDVLKGYLRDGGEVFGEIILLGLTLADAGSVSIQNVDFTTFANITL